MRKNIITITLFFTCFLVLGLKISERVKIKEQIKFLNLLFSDKENISNFENFDKHSYFMCETYKIRIETGINNFNKHRKEVEIGPINFYIGDILYQKKNKVLLSVKSWILIDGYDYEIDGKMLLEKEGPSWKINEIDFLEYGRFTKLLFE